ncbi:MAG TPA: GNAT family N-acetyltransferase [Acetobacteraceae bacterium]|nr:GNAT family N-acetyltransferase [Acetobacteraceae bacterium]
MADDGWRLRAVTTDDIDGLNALAVIPQVYRYLFDGRPPDRTFIADRVAQSIANATTPGLGMWVLRRTDGQPAGLVELRPYPAPRSAELTYLLDPSHWGQGLAVRMAWTVVSEAFRLGQIDTIVAGADIPNTRSFGVMRRLGMRLHKDVSYPLGPGVEFALHRDEAGATPKPPPFGI